MSESEHSNDNRTAVFWRRGLFIFAIILAVSTGVLVWISFSKREEKNNISFNAIEERYFTMFNKDYPDPEDYKFQSLEAYAIEDEDAPWRVYYFVHERYRGWVEIDNEWADYDVVYYGDNGSLENFFCVNATQDILEFYREPMERYNKAVKEGVKKTYTLAEIQKMIDLYKPED